MEVVQREQDLARVEAHARLRELLLPADVEEQLAAVDVLHHKVQALLGTPSYTRRMLLHR